MVIYTKRGDGGETSMYDPENAQRVRISKDSLVFEVLGTIDELNSYLGVISATLQNKQESRDPSTSFYSAQDDSTWIVKRITTIEEIQRNLLTIGSITGGSSLRFSSVQTKKLEKLIDDLEGSLPVLKNFILPGGDITAAQLQFARSLSRRAERRMVSLSKEAKVKPQILQYLNRLSDTLFMLAREVNHWKGIKDEVWTGKKR